MSPASPRAERLGDQGDFDPRAVRFEQLIVRIEEQDIPVAAYDAPVYIAPLRCLPPRSRKNAPMVQVVPARVGWLEALVIGDDVFTDRFGIAVVPGWVGFPEALPHALDDARREPESPWGTHLFFEETDGALVGFGGFKGAPHDGEVELGYAVAPSRQGRGIATAVVTVLVDRARAAGVATVSAHTLAEENASTAVLRKNRFARTAELHDPATGAIWRWERAASPASTDADRSEVQARPATSGAKRDGWRD